MGQNEWLTNPIKRKLLDIKEDLDKKFGENLNGRGHWSEIEFLRQRLVGRVNPHIRLLRVNCVQPILSLYHLNCSTKLKIIQLMSYVT